MKETILTIALWIMTITIFVLSILTYLEVHNTVNDVNGDGKVNLTDLSVLATRIQESNK